LNSFPTPVTREEETKDPNKILVNKIFSFTDKLLLLPRGTMAIALGINEKDFKMEHIAEL